MSFCVRYRNVTVVSYSCYFSLSTDSVNLLHRVASILDLQNSTELGLYIAFPSALKFVGKAEIGKKANATFITIICVITLLKYFIQVNENYSRNHITYLK